MKRTLLSTAVVFALGIPFTAMAEDSFNLNDTSTVASGAVAIGAQSPATNTPVSSYNEVIHDSQNTSFNEAFNEINSDNLVNITQDGNVVFGQNVDQALATSDLSATVTGNNITQDSVHNIGAQNPAPNSQTNNKRTDTNTITASFSGTSGIAMVSQNTGHANSIQQSTVVQSNFSLN